MSQLVDRVEMKPHTDDWAMGDRFGTLVKIGRKFLHVKMDRSGRTISVHPDDCVVRSAVPTPTTVSRTINPALSRSQQLPDVAFNVSEAFVADLRVSGRAPARTGVWAVIGTLSPYEAAYVATAAYHRLEEGQRKGVYAGVPFHVSNEFFEALSLGTVKP